MSSGFSEFLEVAVDAVCPCGLLVVASLMVEAAGQDPNPSPPWWSTSNAERLTKESWKGFQISAPKTSTTHASSRADRSRVAVGAVQRPNEATDRGGT